MKKLFFLIACFFISQWCCSQRLTSKEIHRIGDYGKLWSVLNLFHPEMAYGSINADSLFTDNIDDLLKDPSAANFKKALQKMINCLHDPYTTIENTNKNLPDSIQLPDRPLLRWLGDSIALVYFSDDFMRENGNNDAALLRLIDTLKTAQGIIADVRQKGESYYTPGFMQQFIGYLSDKNFSYPSSRTRIHYGHESETFPIEFYNQGWFVANAPLIKPKKNTIHKPFCFLINRFNSNINNAVAAIQQEGIAKILADDSLGNFEPASRYKMELADSLNVNINLGEVIYSNGNKKFSPDVTIYRDKKNTEDSLINTARQLLKSRNEIKASTVPKLQNTFVTAAVEGYDSLAYPSAPLRLLGLMRYWSTMQYFCANKDLFQKNWDSVLYEYVPKLLLAKDSLEYMFTVARLITEIHDGHGWFSSARFSALQSQVPQVQLKYVESKTIVYKILNDSLKKDITPGDEIISVDGIPVKKLRDSLAQYIGASNNAALQRDISDHLLGGKENTSVNIKLLHNGKPAVITLPRNTKWWVIAYAPNDKEAVWKKLNSNTGYVDFGRLEVSQIDSMFTDFKNTAAIIIDNRSYPKGTVWTMVNYLTGKTVTAAKGTTMIADSPDPLSVTRQEQMWQIPVTPKPDLYKGKIIILVNEITQSQAEYSCMVLQAAVKNVTIIGSQTAGADGDVTGIKLPGGIQTAFSGHGVHYPDGRPTQGIGIVPDIKISPTIKGIREGKDEVLVRAIEVATRGK